MDFNVNNNFYEYCDKNGYGNLAKSEMFGTYLEDKFNEEYMQHTAENPSVFDSQEY